MSVTIIAATSPDIIDAVPERSCDKWGTYRVVVGGENFPQLNLSIDCRKFASDQHGVTWSPKPPVTISVPDMFAAAQTDPLVLDVINAVNALVESQLNSMGEL